MKLTTRVEESGIKYSEGADFEITPLSKMSMASIIPADDIPDIKIDPASRASGRSIESRIVIAGNPKITDSSLTDPLSENTILASFCNLL